MLVLVIASIDVESILSITIVLSETGFDVYLHVNYIYTMLLSTVISLCFTHLNYLIQVEQLSVFCFLPFYAITNRCKQISEYNERKIQ